MDALNTFFVFNLVASIVVLAGFFMLRENVAETAGRMGKQMARFNLAGVTGAATSVVMLASVAALFQ